MTTTTNTTTTNTDQAVKDWAEARQAWRKAERLAADAQAAARRAIELAEEAEKAARAADEAEARAEGREANWAAGGTASAAADRAEDAHTMLARAGWEAATGAEHAERQCDAARAAQEAE